ncbi:MAG: YbjN domain-containing protein [Alphaproteobacteria bacterium]|nr:YbjN domain-containing protein [Alphaproteobacteria bacterium]MCZ6764825.1 YbjN domain-containing protein [Alphaproteobacteria bacterium]
MAVHVADFEKDYDHPLTLVEAAVMARGWTAERTSVDELVAEVTGAWAEYQLLFAWREDIAALHVTCAFDARVPVERKAETFELLALVNDRLWVGHFDVSGPERLPAFRHSLLLRGGILSPEQLEDLVDIALGEVDRFYPAFHYVVWGDRAPADALAATMMVPAGEA